MTTQILIAVCYLVSMIFGFIVLKPKKEKERFIPSNDYGTLIEILEVSIKREIQHKHDLDYKIKDIRVIYNFEEDLKEITGRIMSSLSPSFFEELQYYHSREYIIKHVTRTVQIFLIEFTRANKIKTK